MTAFRIQIELGRLIPPKISAVGPGTFPALALSVDRVAGATQAMWIEYASGAPLPGGRTIKARSGQYPRSIQRQDRGNFSSEIYSRLPYADVLEKGGPARDLKRMLDTSMKVRVNKKGKRYLIIPFRHDTPGASTEGRPMPTAVHALWKDMQRSNVIGMGKRLSGTGAFGINTRKPVMVTARKYRWGDRLSKAQLAGAGITGQKQRHLAGMVNFRAKDGKSHSQYLTFRVMTEDSDGWKTKARQGYWPAKTTSERMRPAAEKLFAEAVKTDVQSYLSAAR